MFFFAALSSEERGDEVYVRSLTKRAECQRVFISSDVIIRVYTTAAKNSTALVRGKAWDGIEALAADLWTNFRRFRKIQTRPF
jgi:hypothetical protein